MDTTEYLAFIPLLLYGIALADLLSEWKRLFDPEKIYLPYLLITIILTEVSVYNIYIYMDLLDKMHDVTYAGYLMFLVPPFAFLMTVNALTPDKDAKSTEIYLKDRMSVIFFLMAAFVASHFLLAYSESIQYVTYYRLVFIAILMATGITKKILFIYILFGCWLIFNILKFVFM